MDHIADQRPPRTVRATVAAVFLSLLLIVVAACGSKPPAE